MNKNTNRKMFAATASAALVASAVVPAAISAEETETEVGFPDVGADNEAASHVQDLLDAGVIEGYEDGTFKPGESVTRAEVAKMVATILDLDTDVSNTNFSDVKENVWYTDSINALYAAEHIDGYEDGTFAPSGELTRAEFATLVVDAYDIPAKSAELPFTDVKEDVWYTENIETLYAHDLIKGQTDSTFAPNDTIKRIDLALLLANTDYKFGDTLPKPGEDDEEVAEDLVVDSVSAIDANNISVSFEGMNEAVEIELNEALNHGENLVNFTYNDQDFEAIVDYVDEDVVEVEEAITAAEEAINALDGVGVTPDNLEDVKAQIAEAKELVATAEEMDENVVFDTYPLEQAEEKVSVLEGQQDVDATVNAAQDAIDALPEYVTEDTLEDVKAQIAEAKELVATAEEMDENVVFDMYPLEQLEEKIAVLEGQMDVDATVNAAQEAIDDLPENVTPETLKDAKLKLAKAVYLVAFAEDLDENVVFDTYPIEQLEEKISVLEGQMDVDETVEAAQGAIDALPGNVTEDTLDDVKAQIAVAKELVATAEEMDENVVFDTYPLEQLEEKVEVLEGQIEVDTAVNAAQDAINAVGNQVVREGVSAANIEELQAQIVEAKELLATAQDMDENVVFDTYPLEQAEEAVAEFVQDREEAQEEIDAAVNAAQDAIEALSGVEEVTADNVEEVQADIAEAKELLATAQEMDENVVFDTYPLEQAEEKVAEFVGDREDDQEEIDTAVNEAQAAIEALSGVEEVTADNVEDVQAQIAAAKDLLAVAQEMDENVVFDTYPLEQAGEKVADFEEAAEAQAAVEAEAITITSVTVEQDDTTLTLPDVAEGYTATIATSSDEDVITTDGVVTPPTVETTVDVVFTVTKDDTEFTANSDSVTVEVPQSSDSATVSSEQELNDALGNDVVKNITLADNFSVEGELEIRRELTLNGNGHILTSTNDGSGESAIKVDSLGSNSVIKNLKVEATGYSNNVVYVSTGENVTLEGNTLTSIDNNAMGIYFDPDSSGTAIGNIITARKGIGANTTGTVDITNNNITFTDIGLDLKDGSGGVQISINDETEQSNFDEHTQYNLVGNTFTKTP